ncbi:MAG: TonB-dependent receptor domain-containing protein [Cytophagales bacterium]
MKNIFKYLLLVFIFLNVCEIYAATIKGTVVDGKTNEQIIGSTVYLTGTTYGTQTGLDGSFVIRNVPAGKYEINASYIGYKPFLSVIKVENEIDTKFVEIEINEQNTDLNEVVVEGEVDKTTDEYASKGIQNSLQVLNVVSAKTIEVSPDLTVANVLQRVSGVTIERNQNGDGQHAIIRGMDKRYNYTLVNGIKIPSPDSKNRYVPLDIFPADLLDRLEVSKSLTPNMEGDAIGGVINMVMKDAPARFMVNANVGTGYGQLFFDKSYTSFNQKNFQNESPVEKRGTSYSAQPSDFSTENLNFSDITPAPNAVFGLSIGNRFLNNKLGVIVAGSYQNTYRGADSKLFEVETQYNNNATKITEIDVRKFSAQQIRSGVHAKIDYKLNPSNKISIVASYINLKDIQSRISSDTNLVISRNGAGTGRGSNKFRSRLENQSIYNATLQGDHSIISNLKVRWSAVYSLATFLNPEQSDIETTYGRTLDSGAIAIETPNFASNKRRWTRNSDQDVAAYLNINYSPTIAGQKIEFSIGGLQRFKNRDNFFNEYKLLPDPTIQAYTGSNLQTFTYAGNIGIGSIGNAYNYTAYENVTGIYGMLKLQVRNVQFIAGARNEITSFGWESEADKSTEGKTGAIKYNNLLPSAHFRYILNSKTNLRGCYYASISRPGFFEVTPYVDNNDDYIEAGNPKLKHTTADNFDLRYEFFPKPLDQLLIGGFFKIIKNPIEYAFVEKQAAIQLQPGNFGTATNYGFEIDFTKYFRIFGIRANYTFTNSEITTSKTYRYTENNPDGSTNQRSRQENQTRPLQGQSMHNGNVSLLLKDQKSGFDAQLAMVYTGRRIVQVSNYKDGDFWQKDFIQLDFSAEKRISKMLTLYVKVNNILNTPYEVVIYQPFVAESSAMQAPFQSEGKDILIKQEFYGQSYFAGLRFKLQ